MTRPANLRLDDTALVEDGLDHAALAETESLFALANGHLGLRGNLDEGEPVGVPGTFLAGCFELRPLPYAEAGYGYPESGQTLVNVTDGKIIRLLVDDEPFDVRYGHVHAHTRRLDLRTGILHRNVDWTSPAGQRLHVTSQRLVSFTQRAVAAIAYEVTPIAQPARVVVQSELVANQTTVARRVSDPRAAARLLDVLVPALHRCREHEVVLVHHIRRSGLRVAAAMDHLVRADAASSTSCDSDHDLGRFTATTVLQPGQSLRLVKLLAYGWSSSRSPEALADQVSAAIVAARHTTWAGLVDEQRRYLDEFWRRADVTIDGDPELADAVRFASFQVLQSAARTEQRPIAAKGLTGNGYDGHTFWDAEAFVLPVLVNHCSDAARDLLRWRHSTLPAARQRADALGLAGAAFPWRTINGDECSGYWPAGTAAFHVNAAIATGVRCYLTGTDDRSFEAEVGAELLIETARLWASLGHHDGAGRFRIDGVTGPDEYSAIADDNVYTNLMARRNLLAAADVVDRCPEVARAVGVDPDEPAAWRRAGAAVHVPFDEHLGVHPQAEGFTAHQRWDFEATPPGDYPLLCTHPYFELYRSQVVKQADLVLALVTHPEAFTREQARRDFAYYEPLTVRDSSLSAPIQAIAAARLGHLELAWDYLAESAFLDIENRHDNVADGIHVGAAAGAWSVLVAGFGGLVVDAAGPAFAPRLPARLRALSFVVAHRGRLVAVEIRPDEARYRLLDGAPIDVRHHGRPFHLTPGPPVTMPVPTEEPPRPVTQPPGRAPLHRADQLS